MQACRGNDQYFYAGQRAGVGAVCAESYGDVPRQGLLHYSLQSRPVSADGLHVAQDAHDTLNFPFQRCSESSIHILVCMGVGPWSVFVTAASAAWNPSLEWVPSQKGLVTEPPQRHSEKAGFPVRSYSLPSASTSFTVPSTRYGPFLFTVILTSDMNPPVQTD